MHPHVVLAFLLALSAQALARPSAHALDTNPLGRTRALPYKPGAERITRALRSPYTRPRDRAQAKQAAQGCAVTRGFVRARVAVGAGGHEARGFVAMTGNAYGEYEFSPEPHRALAVRVTGCADGGPVSVEAMVRALSLGCVCGGSDGMAVEWICGL